MKLPALEAPSLQNWSCHGCSKCCRGGLLITVDAADRQRIRDQKWTKVDGVDPDVMLVPHGHGFRLGHQADGACVFLTAEGRCRIHARFGEPAKPLACRLYPLTFHPAGPRIAVGVRFDCPSAVHNRGTALSDQLQTLRTIAPAALQGLPPSVPAPDVIAGRANEWPELHRVVRRLDALLAATDAPLGHRLLRGLHALTALESIPLAALNGRDADTVVDSAVRQALTAAAAAALSARPPGSMSRILLRQQVLEQGRRTTVQNLEHSNRYRWFLLQAAFQFLTGSGSTPELGEGFRAVPFRRVAAISEVRGADSESLLTRYLRVKLQTVSCCGRAFHELSLQQGFQALCLQVAVIHWVARWHAAASGRSIARLDDIEAAIQRADHAWGHGRSPAPVLRLLMQRGDLERLCLSVQMGS